MVLGHPNEGVARPFDPHDANSSVVCVGDHVVGLSAAVVCHAKRAQLLEIALVRQPCLTAAESLKKRELNSALHDMWAVLRATVLELLLAISPDVMPPLELHAQRFPGSWRT